MGLAVSALRFSGTASYYRRYSLCVCVCLCVGVGACVRSRYGSRGSGKTSPASSLLTTVDQSLLTAEDQLPNRLYDDSRQVAFDYQRRSVAF